MLYSKKYIRVKNVRYGCIIFCLTIMISCQHTNTHPYENELGIRPANLAQIDTANYTTIEWINTVKDIGAVAEGDSILIKFKFRNTGVHPLFISGVRPSCGCTVAQYPINAIMPGEASELAVSFDTLGQAGNVHKTIIVTSNTSNGVKHLLSFNGQVKQLNTNARSK